MPRKKKVEEEVPVEEILVEEDPAPAPEAVVVEPAPVVVSGAISEGDLVSTTNGVGVVRSVSSGRVVVAMKGRAIAFPPSAVKKR